MSLNEFGDILRKFEQPQKVKFLNRLRNIVSGGDDKKKISDFDLIRYVIDCPGKSSMLALSILDEK